MARPLFHCGTLPNQRQEALKTLGRKAFAEVKEKWECAPQERKTPSHDLHFPGKIIFVFALNRMVVNLCFDVSLQTAGKRMNDWGEKKNPYTF